MQYKSLNVHKNFIAFKCLNYLVRIKLSEQSFISVNDIGKSSECIDDSFPYFLKG